jgi:hypothetical protein
MSASCSISCSIHIQCRRNSPSISIRIGNSVGDELEAGVELDVVFELAVALEVVMNADEGVVVADVDRLVEDRHGHIVVVDEIIDVMTTCASLIMQNRAPNQTEKPESHREGISMVATFACEGLLAMRAPHPNDSLHMLDASNASFTLEFKAKAAPKQCQAFHTICPSTEDLQSMPSPQTHGYSVVASANPALPVYM